MGELQELADAEGLKPSKYIIGDKIVDGHDHIFYLRDDLPIATTTKDSSENEMYHSHSITEGPNNTIICGKSPEWGDHIHTKLVIETVGDYAPRTLYTT